MRHGVFSAAASVVVRCALLRGAACAACAVALAACASDAGLPPATLAPGEAQVGLATWYGAALAGRRTASGERFDPERMTAAHRTLPFGTWVEVSCPDTGRRVRVRVTDRGPFGHADRIIDLSRRAARELGILREGVARVELRIVAGP